MEYLKVYRNDPDSKVMTNTEKGLARKMSSLRSFYAYYFKMQMIRTNPTVLVEMPKLHEKAIVIDPADNPAAIIKDIFPHHRPAGHAVQLRQLLQYEIQVCSARRHNVSFPRAPPPTAGQRSRIAHPLDNSLRIPNRFSLFFLFHIQQYRIYDFNRQHDSRHRPGCKQAANRKRHKGNEDCSHSMGRRLIQP